MGMSHSPGFFFKVMDTFSDLNKLCPRTVEGNQQAKSINQLGLN